MYKDYNDAFDDCNFSTSILKNFSSVENATSGLFMDTVKIEVLDKLGVPIKTGRTILFH